MDTPKIIIKFTVPVRTSNLVGETVKAELASRGLDLEFHVASNPEFLKEGAAVSDFMKPDRIIVGTDVEHVRQGIDSDTRIGYPFIYPGCGNGGSCFPKGVQALLRTAHENRYQSEVLAAVEAVNKRQKRRLVDLITRHYDDDIQGKTFALWGLAFKPKTDDMREAPSRVMMETLREAGANVQAHHPEAMD
jgi:UDP-glucose 6-dehydrogenase